MNTDIANPTRAVASGALVTDGRLAESLGLLTKIVNKWTTVPILSNVLLEHDGMLLRASVTDLETRAIAEIPCDISEGAFRTTVVAKSLLGMLKGKKGPVKLQLLEEKLYVTVGGATTAMPTLDATDFPPKMQGEIHVDTIADYASFCEAFVEASAFASREEARGAVLMATYLDFEKMRVIGCDGYSAAFQNLVVGPISDTRPKKNDGKSDPLQFMVPTSIAVLLSALKLPKAISPTVRLTIDSKRLFGLSVNMPGVRYEFSAKLVAGIYPNVDAIVPGRPCHVYSVNRKALLAALKSASNVLERNGYCTFDFAGEFGNLDSVGLKLSAGSDVLGSFEADVDIVATVTNGSLETGFQVKRMIAALRPFDQENVQLALVSPTTALTLSNVDGTGAVVLLMPIRR